MGLAGRSTTPTLSNAFSGPALVVHFILAADNNSPLNQDGDGTAGEATADRYSASFRYDAVGMQVSSTTPASGSTIALPFTTLDVNFNEPYAAASVGVDDLELSQGTVTGFTLLDADTVRYMLSNVSDASLTLVLNVKYGALTDLFGFPIQAYAGNFTVPDVVTSQYPAPFSAIMPLGSLVYDSHIPGAINVAADTDSFTINLDAGLKVTILADPGAALRPVLTFKDPANAVLAANTAAAAGLDALIQTITTTTTGSI
jgi:hypothetical protein